MERHVIFDTNLCTKSDLTRVGLYGIDFISLKKFKEEGELVSGDAYLGIGEEVYKYLSKKVHMGLRKVTFNQVCDLRKVTTNDGTIFSFVAKAVGTTKLAPRAQYFMSKELPLRLKPLPESAKIITKDLQVAIKWLREWIDGTYEEKNFQGFGLDYETANVTDGNKKICGVGIASLTRGIFIDFRFPKSDEEWSEFSKVYIEFLQKYMDVTWVYNAQFEFDRTLETFGVRIDFKDAGAMNVVDNRQRIYYSLKYTAQYYLGVASWDDDFDDFAHYLKSSFKKYKSFDEMFADKEFMDDLKSRMIDEDDFEEWKQITKMVPEYYNDQFWNQTSRLLGKYCIQDSYNTLMIAVVQLPKYPKLANDLIVDNLRLGCQLHSTGCFLDVDKRSKLNLINWKYQAFSSMKLVEIYYLIKMSDLDLSFLDSFSTNCRLLIDKGINPTSKDFIKNLGKKLTDKDSENDIDEYGTYSLLGDKAESFINIFRKAKKSITSVTRSKNLRSKVEDLMKDFITDEDKSNYKKYSDNIKLYQNNQSYGKRLNVLYESEIYGKHFDEVPEDGHFMFDGKSMNFEDITKHIKKKWKNVTAPTEINEIRDAILNSGNGYYACYLRLMQVDKNAFAKYFPKDEIKDPFEYYHTWKKIGDDLLLELRKELLATYPDDKDPIIKYNDKEYFDELKAELSDEDYKDARAKRLEMIQEIQSKPKYEILRKVRWPWKLLTLRWNGLTPIFQAQLGKNNYDGLRVIAHIQMDRWKDESFLDTRIAVRKHAESFGTNTQHPLELVLQGIMAIHMLKAYSKESQYINGLFSDKQKEVEIINDQLMFKPKRGTGIYHIPTKFNICRLETKRSSSGFHTIPSSTTIKGIIKAPDGYAMSYFDVSQAEPRTCAYLLDGDKMKECYESGMDLYYLTAASMHGQTYEEFLQRKDAKKFRAHFKVVLLGLLYGMGADTLAKSIGTDTETAKQYIKALFKMFPKLEKSITEMKKYPLTHNRLIKTFWGDKLTTNPGREDEMMRHGINYAVQGSTSIALTGGFYNVMARCRDAKILVRPVLAVHDALINYFKVEMIFDLNAFYRHNFEIYLFNRCGVRYKFSVDYGVDYYNVCTVTNIDDDTIEMDGKNKAIKGLLDALDKADYPYEIVSQEGPIEPNTEYSIGKYLKSRGNLATYDEDTTYNKVVIHRLAAPRYYVPKYDEE